MYSVVPIRNRGVMDTKYLVAISRNIDVYLKHHGITHYAWMRIQLLICAKLYEQYPKPIPLNDFIDDQNNPTQVSRAVRDLKDNCGFLITENYANGEKGKAKLLHLTDKGVEFIKYIEPTE